MAFCHCSGKFFIRNWRFGQFLPPSCRKTDTPKKMKKSNFYLVSSWFSPKHIFWSYKFDGRKIRSFASCLGKNERRYQLKILLFHFLRGVQFRADLGQNEAKYLIANKYFSWTVAERHCLCRHCIGLSECKNTKIRTLPNFFPLSQISGFGCLTTCVSG